MKRILSAVWPPVLFGAVFLLIWEAIVRIGDVQPFLLPAPSAIWSIELAWPELTPACFRPWTSAFIREPIAIDAAYGPVLDALDGGDLGHQLCGAAKTPDRGRGDDAQIGASGFVGSHRQHLAGQRKLACHGKLAHRSPVARQ